MWWAYTRRPVCIEEARSLPPSLQQERALSPRFVSLISWIWRFPALFLSGRRDADDSSSGKAGDHDGGRRGKGSPLSAEAARLFQGESSGVSSSRGRPPKGAHHFHVFPGSTCAAVRSPVVVSKRAVRSVFRPVYNAQQRRGGLSKSPVALLVRFSGLLFLTCGGFLISPFGSGVARVFHLSVSCPCYEVM